MNLFPAFILGVCIFPVAQAAVGLTHVSSALNSEVLVYQDFAKTDSTGFSFGSSPFPYTGAPISFGGSALDEGVDVYRLSASTILSPDTIGNSSLMTLYTFGTSYHYSSIFYVGLVTPSKAVSDLYPSLHAKDAFGWAKFSFSGGVFTLLDSAIDYSGQGIIVGTTTVVPEPMSCCGLALGTAGFLALSRRRRV